MDHTITKGTMKVGTCFGLRDLIDIVYIRVRLMYLRWYIKTFEHGGQTWREVNLHPYRQEMVR